MIRRPTKRGVSYAVASSLLAVMLLGPAGASAATPSVILGGSLTPTPGTVSPGETVAFTVSLTNNDTSTMSQLSLTTLDPTLTVAAASSATGNCSSSSPLSCTFRNVKPGDTVAAFVVLNAKSSSFGVTFKWDTTGRGPDKGGNSHGDSFYFPQGATTTTAGTPIAVGVNGDTTNYRSRYVLTTSQTTVANTQAVGSANKHATKVVAPGTGIPVEVFDGSTIACPAGLACFGESSTINVAGGATFPGGFQVVITMDSSEIPGGVNAKNVRIYHSWDGGSETISATCTFAGGQPTSMPCLVAKKVGGKDLEVTVWTTHNGVMRGLG